MKKCPSWPKCTCIMQGVVDANGFCTLPPKTMKKNKKKYNRGTSQHYRMLQEQSMKSRISRTFKVEFQLMPGGKLPWRLRETDAGFDLHASENVQAPPMEVTYVKTGVRIVPPAGYFFRIAPRSGVTKLGILVIDGTIDAGYTGEILIPLLNTSRSTFIIRQGDRIAQAIFAPILYPQFVHVEKFTENGKNHRGPKGFGSSGR